MLFTSSIWHNGIFHSLITESASVGGCIPVGINNDGLILGHGSRKTVSFPQVLVLWDSYSAEPQIVEKDGVYGVVPPGIDFGGPVAADMLLDDAGRFIGYAYNPSYSSQTFLAVWKMENQVLSYQGLPADQQETRYVLSDNVSFGGDTSGYYLTEGLVKTPFEGPIYRISRKPQNERLILFRTHPYDIGTKIATSQMALGAPGDPWRDATTRGGIDMTLDDILIREGNYLRFRSRIHQPSFVAPGIPLSWNEQAGLFDASPKGFLLGYRNHPSEPKRFEIAVFYPLKVKDDHPESGLDYQSAQAHSGPDEARKTPDADGKFWIMVPVAQPPASGNPETVQVVIHTPAAADRPLTLEVSNITFTPSVLTAPETLVSIQTSQSDPTELDVLFKLGNESAISNPVGIKVMKRNTIQVTVHLMAYQNPDGNATGSAAKIGPDFSFTKENIEAELNRIYGPQTNTFFEVTMRGNVVLKLVDWDSEFPVGDPRRDNGNLDLVDGVNEGDGGPGPEGSKFVDASNDLNADINVWIVAHPGNGLQHHDSTQPVTIGYPLNGVGMPGTSQVFIDGMTGILEPNPPTQEQLDAAFQRRLRTIAHEIGHVFLGAGHPGQGTDKESGGISPLPATRHPHRLMWAPSLRQILAPTPPDLGELLVKEEWDKIETWILSQ